MEERFEEIRLLKETHDGILTELEKSTEVIKGQCCEIDDELNLHNEILTDIQEEVEKNQELMDRVTMRLDKLLEKYSNNSLLCIIFLLLLILIIVIFL